MINEVLTNILYGMSGFFFAIFALRYVVRSRDKIKNVYGEVGFSSHFFLACLPSFILILVALVLFPVLFYTRTQIGGFVYLATYIFFSMKIRGRR